MIHKQFFSPLCLCGILTLLAGCASFEENRARADLGDPEMQYRVGVAFYDGKSVPYSPKDGDEYLMKAIESGHMRAAYKMADEILKKNDTGKAEKLLRSYEIIFSRPPSGFYETIDRNTFKSDFAQRSYFFLQALHKEEKWTEADKFKKACLDWIAQDPGDPYDVATKRWCRRIEEMKSGTELAAIKAEEEQRAKEEAERKKAQEEEERRAAERVRLEREKKLMDLAFKFPGENKDKLFLLPGLESGTSLAWIQLRDNAEYSLTEARVSNSDGFYFTKKENDETTYFLFLPLTPKNRNADQLILVKVERSFEKVDVDALKNEYKKAFPNLQFTRKTETKNDKTSLGNGIIQLSNIQIHSDTAKLDGLSIKIRTVDAKITYLGSFLSEGYKEHLEAQAKRTIPKPLVMLCDDALIQTLEENASTKN